MIVQPSTGILPEFTSYFELLHDITSAESGISTEAPITLCYELHNMPVEFEEYDPESTSLRLEEGSNAHEILLFLLENPNEGYTPKEIHEATGVPRGSVGTTLARLKENGLVRHKEPYWAVARDDRLAVFAGSVLSLKTADERFPVEDEDEWLENAVDPR